MAQRKDYQLAKTKTFALEKDTYELLLKYAGLASKPILAKEKLIAIDPETKAILIRLANRIAADAISVEDAGEFYSSKTLEEVLQEIGTGTITNAIWDADHDTGIQVEEGADDDTIRFDIEGVEVLNATADLWVFNENGDDVDFRWEGNTEVNLLYLDAGTDRVGIGTAAPTYELDVVGNIGLSQFLHHNDDPDTYLEFLADHVQIYVGGIDIFDALITAIIFNDGSANVDFRVEGNANANLLVLDAGNNNVSINALPVSANYDLGLLGDGVLCLTETATPAADANYGKVYCKNDNKLYFQDGAGAEKALAALAAAEVTQLENINATTISIGQWAALGGLDVTAKARATLTVAQVGVASGGETLIEFDAETYDPGGNFNVVNYRFVVPTTGYYLIAASLYYSVGTVVADKRYSLIIKKNGVADLSYSFMHSSVVKPMACMVSDIHYLVATDFVQIYAWHDAGVNQTIANDAPGTYFSIALLI